MEGYGPQIQSQSQAQQGGISWVPGATTVGVICQDGVILAAEKRVSYGFFIASKGGKKVFPITEQIGAACHEGYQSCFFCSVEGEGASFKVTEPQLKTPGQIYGKK